MWNLKYGTNEPSYEQKQTHREQTFGCRGEGGGGGWIGNLELADVNYYIENR